jgi:putative DNA-invertase from lambdoid prophage Rac
MGTRVVPSSAAAHQAKRCGLPDGHAVVAEFERELLRERVRAGIAQARKEGRPHGRPQTASLQADQVLRLQAERVSHSAIARRLGIGRTSVRRILATG